MTAADGRDALEVLKEEWVDLVLTDINMPNMNGMELLEEMKEDEILKTIPVVMVTTEGSEKIMNKAAIYCRVSTEDQEREGTSLQTQLEACLKYCQDKCFDVAYRFSEACSGLTLDRPKLNELRELVRDKQIDVVVIYCLDRLSRDPGGDPEE